MKNSFTRIVLTTTALLLSASLAFATDLNVKTPDVKGAAKATSDSAKGSVKGAVTDSKASATAVKDSAKGTVADAKTAAKSKVLDLNSASEAELKAIPGIGDTYAAKIVAGRPYANKAQLKSRKIVPDTVYEKVKDLITAKQVKK